RTCLFGTIKYILCNIGMDNEYYDLAAKLNKEDRNIHNAFQENCTTSHSENIQQQGFGDAGIILSSFSILCKIEFRVCFMQNNNITQIFPFDENFNFTHCAYILYDGNRRHYDPLCLLNSNGTYDAVVLCDAPHTQSLFATYIRNVNKGKRDYFVPQIKRCEGPIQPGDGDNRYNQQIDFTLDSTINIPSNVTNRPSFVSPINSNGPPSPLRKRLFW
ncbi:unnamed protein product, partial [Didymodactylos carnosus]